MWPPAGAPPEQKRISLDNAFLPNGPVRGVRQRNMPHHTSFQSSHGAFQRCMMVTELNLSKRAFSVGAPDIWNELPTTLTSY